MRQPSAPRRSDRASAGRTRTPAASCQAPPQRFAVSHRSRRLQRSLLAGAAAILALPVGLAATPPAAAWTPRTQLEIAAVAATLLPPDLARQIERHRRSYHEGVAAPFADGDPLRHYKNLDGTGLLDAVVLAEFRAAVDAIRGHQRFADVVFRLGVISHYVADANYPLSSSDSDPLEVQFGADYGRYAETAQRRFAVVFYGLDRHLDRSGDVNALLRRTLARGRDLYPYVGREYRRVGGGSGLGRFDDRSTAFGVAAISFSRAVSDVAVVLRQVWIEAGGADERSPLLARSSGLMLVPRVAAAP